MTIKIRFPHGFFDTYEDAKKFIMDAIHTELVLEFGEAIENCQLDLDWFMENVETLP
jgi:hypothetical protein